jgi:uroporphyrinogen-III synthase
MPIQSRLPAFLLTRPAALNARFADALRGRFGPDLAITASPLIAPELLDTSFPLGPWGGLIFTSETGVAAFVHHPARPDDLPKTAFCVGDRTAEAALLAGLVPVSADGDAVALIALIRKLQPPGPLLHICGANTRGDVAKKLSALGHSATAFVLYAQHEQMLDAAAQALLLSARPVLAPLLSPRTAALFRAQLATLPRRAPLICAALSDAVADELAGMDNMFVCRATKPTAESLIKAIEGYLVAQQLP